MPTSFNFNFMQATLSEEVEVEFKRAFGKAIRKGAASMTQWRWGSRYIIYTFLSHGWNYWCGLGYFSLHSDDFTSYPYIGICLEVSPAFKYRPEIIKAMNEVVNKKHEIWTPRNLTVTPAWSGIVYRKSLQEFLSYEEQLFPIKNFFLESIKELKTVQEEYFNFPLKVVTTDEAIEKESEIEGEDSPNIPLLN